MSENPLSLNETRRITEEIDISPRKSLGQNFLIDGNIVRKSIELADLSPGEIVVEIGPGLGTLTRALLGTGALVHAVEKDPKLSKYLRETLVQEYPETFVLIEGDAMEFPLAGFYPEPNDSFKIVANLP
ncbi:MAG TPA: rRNA adenine N-6-methyltransferase family protein, partial [Opitutales bacterium]|nr:rRNA adenine N-6-methyltransferase family protein [Opitutales bacterium]